MYYRAAQTKEQIAKAFLELLQEKTIGDITVSEVCEKARLNRTTFYKHYRSCGDIITELEEEQLAELRALLSEEDRPFPKVLTCVCRSIDAAREKKLVRNGTEISDRLRNGWIATAKEYGLQIWKSRLPKVDGFNAEISYEALLAGTLQAVLAMGDRVSSEKKAALILDMINAYIRSRS